MFFGGCDNKNSVSLGLNTAKARRLAETAQAHERKMKAQMEATLEASREAETGSQALVACCE